MNQASIRSRAQLSALIESGGLVDFLFFWGHRPSANGAVSKSCLSQWFAASFMLNGKTFMTAEHFMMAKKAELFGQPDLAEQILAASDPGKAKALGRKVANFHEEVWERERWRIVVEANLLKFGQNRRLGSFLKGTGSSVLVEASPLDAIWGIGLDANSPDAQNPQHWRGLNLLGFALMEVRDVLFGAAAQH
jgi:ribA/ribD-fused uncharacterized protein